MSKRAAGGRKLTEAQILLGEHLRELVPHLTIEFEHIVSSDRKWRFDVAIPFYRWGFECNGHWQGHHGAGWSEGTEKLNHAQALGWRVFQFHNRDVLSGKAKSWIKKHLLGQKGREG